MSVEGTSDIDESILTLEVMKTWKKSYLLTKK